MSDSVIDIFLQCDQAIRRGRLIHRNSRSDKEFHFQDWFQERLNELEVTYDPPARNSYPDFRIVNTPVGYEIKGLAYPGRGNRFIIHQKEPFRKGHPAGPVLTRTQQSYYKCRDRGYVVATLTEWRRKLHGTGALGRLSRRRSFGLTNKLPIDSFHPVSQTVGDLLERDGHISWRIN